MISKELLSKVLDINCTAVELPLEGSMLGFQTDNKMFLHLINIYELAHKCKEWAYPIEDNYVMSSGYHDSMAFCVLESLKDSSIQFYADTEPEAVFAACQWILEQNNDN